MKYLKALIGVVLWLPVALLKVGLILAGLIVVPLALLRGRLPSLYQAGPGRPVTFWELAIRNPVGGFDYLIDPPYDFEQWGEVLEATVTEKRLQVRVRFAGFLVSLRLLWRYNEDKYGELYVGWKLGSRRDALDFALSLRPWATVGQ